jgi:hypothetical protein
MEVLCNARLGLRRFVANKQVGTGTALRQSEAIRRETAQRSRPPMRQKAQIGFG